MKYGYCYGVLKMEMLDNGWIHKDKECQKISVSTCFRIGMILLCRLISEKFKQNKTGF